MSIISRQNNYQITKFNAITYNKMLEYNKQLDTKLSIMKHIKNRNNLVQSLLDILQQGNGGFSRELKKYNIIRF